MMFSYIANYGKVTPCFVNDPSPPPIVQAFHEGKMLGPLVRRDNPGIFNTPEAALKALEETTVARKSALADAELYTYDGMGVKFYKHIQTSGKIKALQFIPNSGVHLEVDLDSDKVYHDFDTMMAAFLRDAMNEVEELKACNKPELITQFQYLDLQDIQRIRLIDSFLPKMRGLVYNPSTRKK